MTIVRPHLHLVPADRPGPEADLATPSDLALLASLLAVGAFPLLAALCGLDGWGDATLGAAAALAVWSGHELAAILRAGRRP